MAALDRADETACQRTAQLRLGHPQRATAHADLMTEANRELVPVPVFSNS